MKSSLLVMFFDLFQPFHSKNISYGSNDPFGLESPFFFGGAIGQFFVRGVQVIHLAYRAFDDAEGEGRCHQP